jgi:glycosyltransferase involved in cell wall biosynthesis
MKSFLLVTGDFVKTGGMDRANYALADYLARQSVEVHLVAHRVDSQLQNYPNVFWHRVPKIAKSYFLSEFLLNAVGRFWAKRITAQGGRVLVNGGNCNWSDVNWVHYVHAAYRPDTQASFLQRLKGAFTHQIYCQAEKRSLKNARIIIANSYRTVSDLMRHKLTTSAKICPIYYGTDLSKFYPACAEEVQSLRQKLNLPLNRSIVIFIGALGDRRKGFDVLFQAWKQLCQDPNWDSDLIVVGQGAELLRWKQRVRDEQLSDRIQFLGFRADVPDLLRASDCLIAPTRYEAYGLGVHEALCCGIPAIVTATAGVAERYTKGLTDLLLTDANNVSHLIDKLYHWQSHQNRYRQILHKQVVPQLHRETWDYMAQQIVHAVETPTFNTVQTQYSTR